MDTQLQTKIDQIIVFAAYSEDLAVKELEFLREVFDRRRQWIFKAYQRVHDLAEDQSPEAFETAARVVSRELLEGENEMRAFMLAGLSAQPRAKLLGGLIQKIQTAILALDLEMLRAVARSGTTHT